MQCEQRIELHDCEVVPEEDERRDVYDVHWPVPEMRQKLRCTSRKQPDAVTEYNVPPWQMVAAVHDGDRRLVHDVGNQARPDQKREGVEELVHLIRERLRAR